MMIRRSTRSFLHAGCRTALACLLFVALGSCSSSSTGPIIALTSGDINATALLEALNRTDDPERPLIFKGNMASGASTNDAFTGALEAHMYALSLEDEALTEILVDGSTNAVTVYFIEALDRGASFSSLLATRPLIETSPFDEYERRGRISGILKRGQYLIVLWPTAAINYRLAAEWAAP